MANEITITTTLTYAKNGVTWVSRTDTTTIDQTASGVSFVQVVQNVGTSEEAITLGDISTPGFLRVKNLDATNFVLIRHGTGGSDLVKLKPGEHCLLRLDDTDASAPYIIADTAACDCEITLIAD
jgi:hypothetical protein